MIRSIRTIANSRFASLDELLSGLGAPRQRIVLQNLVVYCLYKDVCAKVRPDLEGQVVLYRALPVQPDGTKDDAALPVPWVPPDPVIRHAVVNGEVVQGMRLEDVVLAVGVPDGLGEHSGIGVYWQTIVGDYWIQFKAENRWDLVAVAVKKR